MNRLLTAICLAALLFLPSPLCAEEGFLRVPLTEKNIPAPRVSWYGIYMKDSKIGYMREEFARVGEGADAMWYLDQTATLKIESMGKKLAMEMAERQEFDAAPPYAFRGGWSRMKEDSGGGQDIEITRDASGLSAKVTAGGESRTLPVPAIDCTLADQLASELWIRTNPAPGDHARVRTFKMNDLKADADTLTVISRKESLVEGVRTRFFEVRQVGDSDGQEEVARCDAQGRLISIVLGDLIEGRLEPEEVAKRIEASSDLFVFGMAAIDKPIGDPTKVRRLVMHVDGEGAGKLVDGPGQSLARDAKLGEVTLTLGADAGIDEKATAEETKASLEETVRCPSSLPQVKALAAQAVADAKTPREKVARLLHFVSEYVTDELHPQASSVPEIIASKRGDCSEHALLFAALARSAGIPAREVSGLVYMGDDVKAFGGHAWDEVVLDGRWVPVDPTWDETEINATHITLDRKGKSQGSIATLGRLQFRLVTEDVAK